MKGHAFLLVFITAVALASCSTESELASGGGNEILFNVEEVPFKPDSTSGCAATRASKLTSVSSFKLYAYNSSGTTIADGVTYTKSGNSWTTTSKVFWPQTGNVTFYAFSPASNSSVTFNTPSKTLTYTAPTGESSQQDVLYAYKTSARPTNNTVDLTFNHANAAFSVNARLATGCTATVNVSGVSLVNVKPTNTLTFTNGSASASGSNITSAIACSAKTLTTSNQAISSSPLIIPPQSVTAWNGTSALANTYLAVTCKVSENESYVVGSASANGTVYVPMDKTLNKGEDNSVNLVFGTLSDGNRSYGRDANGNRISVSEKIIIDGHEAVDLGLSVMWATMNVGANSIEESGNYYAWGETDNNNGNATNSRTSPNATGWNYSYSTTPYCTDPSNYDQASAWSKYNTESATLNLIDDAAHVAWGGSWRMPTYDECLELYQNCTSSVVERNGIEGLLVTSAKEGYTNKSIFLPFATQMRQDVRSGKGLFYTWSASSGVHMAMALEGEAYSHKTSVSSNQYQYFHPQSFPKYLGLNVRAVYPK